MRYMADAYCPREPPYQIWTQYDLRQRSYKAKCVRLRLKLIHSDSLTHWTHKIGKLFEFDVFKVTPNLDLQDQAKNPISSYL